MVDDSRRGQAPGDLEHLGTVRGRSTAAFALARALQRTAGRRECQVRRMHANRKARRASQRVTLYSELSESARPSPNELSSSSGDIRSPQAFQSQETGLAPRRHHPRIVDTMRAALLIVQLAAVAAEHLSVEYPACTDAPGASFQYSNGFYYSCPTLVNSGLCGWCWGDGHGCVTDSCPASCSPNCVSPPPPSVPPFFPAPPPGPPTPPFAPSTPLVPGDCSVVGKMTDTPHDVAGAHAPS